MLKNDFFRLIRLVLMCLVLFFLFDAASVLLASLLVYFKTEVFLLNWADIFSSFLQTGYIGGIVLGTAIWIKIKIQEHQIRKKNNRSN